MYLDTDNDDLIGAQKLMKLGQSALKSGIPVILYANLKRCLPIEIVTLEGGRKAPNSSFLILSQEILILSQKPHFENY